MAEQLKNMFFQRPFFEKLASLIEQNYPEFPVNDFLDTVFDDKWEALALKAKMRRASECLHQFLPPAYPDALALLRKVALEFHGFDAMLFPDFVECYGLDDPELSLPALGLFTLNASSEFAIRPFLQRDETATLEWMKKWAANPHPQLRRLASEGCRPRLPWAMALPAFKKDPAPILPILEMLKNDPSESVRRSVANNLNDISKDNPDITLEICENWFGCTPETDWIVKHACRGLLKAGVPGALRLFGFDDPEHIEISQLQLTPERLLLGDELNFSFELVVKSTDVSKIRLEYAIDYVKASGKTSRKIFQIHEKEYTPGRYEIQKKQSFQDFTTRKHFPGQHELDIIVNGIVKASINFDVIAI